MALTRKQQRFVDEYLIDLNATQASLRAGYSKKTAKQMGTENLAKPAIKSAIEEAITERADRTKMDADKVLREFARLARSDILNYVSFGRGGVAIQESSLLTEDQARAIAEVSETVNVQGVRRIKFKLHDKNKALENLAKHLDLIVDKHEVTGKNGGPLPLLAEVCIVRTGNDKS